MNKSLMIGAVFSLASALAYAVLTATIKAYVVETPMPLLIFMQSIVCLFLTMLFVIRKYKWQFISLNQFSSVKRYHFLRAIFSLGLSYLLFLSLSYIPYIDAILLFNTFPLWAIIFGFILFKNELNLLVIPMVVVGFLGVLFSIGFDRGVFSFGALLAVGSAISAALSILMQKKALTKDDSIKSLFYYFLVATVISGLISIPYWHSLHHIGILIIAGVLLFVSQAGLILATQFTIPQVVSALYYSNIVFSLVISLIYLNGSLSVSMLFGMFLIIISGLGVVYFQSKTNKKKSHQMTKVKTLSKPIIKRVVSYT
ncbi:MAG: DMT family transporter [Gammaproteobacteria bacterium]|nr:MAG: DMT family transporter [Gammaproteobacteria bacterium]UTW42387.1 DMT family transporter [bacterium SCSIO 12844]